MIAVQRQRGGVDCGLFAIAMATAIAFGIDPGSQEFNQGEMSVLTKRLCYYLQHLKFKIIIILI